MKSIYFKNFAATAAMVLFSFLILGTAFVFLGRSYVISEYRGNMVSNAEEVSHAAQALVRSGELTSWDLRMVISTLAQSTGNHIFITDTDGTVVSCSCRNIACEHLGRTLTGSAMTQLRSDGKLNLITSLGGFYSSAHYVVAQPINIGSAARVVGYVFVATNSATIIDGWRTFVWVFLAASAAVMMIALLLSLVTSKRMAQPLDEMAVAAKKFAHGDFSARVTDDGRTDEVGALISAFNTMADSLETSEERRNAFIANVSHELKTPMTTIAGFADGILDGTIPKDQEDKYLVTIADETRRLSRLVRSMLDMSRVESTGEDLTRRREFDISDKIVSTMLSFEARANDKQLDVDLQLPEDPMLVLGDPDAITRVLYNLMDNAVKFAAPGSTLCVSLWKSEGKAYVSVRDHGETIPADDLPFIFDRFHKSDRSRSLDRDGVGLGLYLVKSILDAHGEDIAVTSRDGETEFVFTLTLAKPAPKPTAKPEAPAVGADARVHELFAEFIECSFSIHKQHKIVCYHQIVPWEGHHTCMTTFANRSPTGMRPATPRPAAKLPAAAATTPTGARRRPPHRRRSPIRA